MCIPCILIPLLVGLISALLGYLLGRLLSKGNDNSDDLRIQLGNLTKERDKHLSLSNNLTGEVDGWKTKFGNLEAELASLKANANVSVDNSADLATIAQLKADLEACRNHSSGLSAQISSLSGELEGLKLSASTPVDLPFDADLAASVFGKKIKQDDLKIVEGIGPKIEELFHAAGIKTWKSLSEASFETCRAILDGGGEHYQVHDPATWPKQSLLAYEGKWAELKAWQDVLDGGK